MGIDKRPSSLEMQNNLPPESLGDKPLDFSPSTDSKAPPENKPKATPINLNTILSDINTSELLNEVLQGNACDEPLEISSTFNQSSDTLKNINSIKNELCKLSLDPCELNYINNSITPLLNILYQLSTTSYNLASSSNILSTSSVVHRKRHELKETIHLTYKINENCEEIYAELKKRLNVILNSQ